MRSHKVSRFDSITGTEIMKTFGNIRYSRALCLMKSYHHAKICKCHDYDYCVSLLQPDPEENKEEEFTFVYITHMLCQIFSEL